MAMADWIIRESVPQDESCLVSTWLKSFAHSKDIAETGLANAHVDGHQDEIRYWRIHQPIVTALLSRCSVRVACAEGRSEYAEGKPAIILAWACLSPNYVHWVCVKRNVARIANGEVAREIVADLLGDAWNQDRRMTFDLLDLRKLGPYPETWRRDRSWLSTMRSLSVKRLEKDATFGEVASDVLASREWRPNSERAA
jgi:hypothetical protein